MTNFVNDGLYRIGAMYGEVIRDGKVLAEVVEISATIEVNRIEIPLVGTQKQGYKPGRESREGTFRIQQIDSEWQMEVHKFMSQSLADRRSQRGSGTFMRPFNLQIKLDDPEALGYETWQLNGCLLWRLQLGFNITDDIIDREFPFTWESEQALAHFKRTGGVDPATGLPAVVQTEPTG